MCKREVIKVMRGSSVNTQALEAGKRPQQQQRMEATSIAGTRQANEMATGTSKQLGNTHPAKGATSCSTNSSICNADCLAFSATSQGRQGGNAENSLVHAADGFIVQCRFALQLLAVNRHLDNLPFHYLRTCFAQPNGRVFSLH